VKRVESGAVLTNSEIAKNIYAMTIRLPLIAQACKPGQFVMVYLDRSEMMLPRPISIADADDETLTLIYQAVGQGTEYLSRLRPNDALRTLGPLGNGFTIPDELTHATLVGGGIGTPPLYFLAQELLERGVQVSVYLGFRDESIMREDFASLGIPPLIATDSGAYGFHGNVVALLRETKDAPELFYACGPTSMLYHLAQYAKAIGVPCQVSVEERMACGVGACLGCAVENAARDPKYIKVCCDGPVFYSDQVVLHG